VNTFQNFAGNNHLCYNIIIDATTKGSNKTLDPFQITIKWDVWWIVCIPIKISNSVIIYLMYLLHLFLKFLMHLFLRILYHPYSYFVVCPTHRQRSIKCLLPWKIHCLHKKEKVYLINNKYINKYDDMHYIQNWVDVHKKVSASWCLSQLIKKHYLCSIGGGQKVNVFKLWSNML
jgi:hypothetical protein